MSVETTSLHVKQLAKITIIVLASLDTKDHMLHVEQKITILEYGKKTMTISLINFLEYATHNRLFPYVYIPNTIAAELLLDDPTHEKCFVECMNHEVSCVYYPVTEWIAERKRRAEVSKQHLDFNLVKSNTEIKRDRKELTQLMMKAAASGNLDEMQRIAKEMEKIK